MDQEVKNMFNQVLAAIQSQGAKIDMLVTEVALIKDDITGINTEVAGLHEKFDYLRDKVHEHDIAIWQVKHQVG